MLKFLANLFKPKSSPPVSETRQVPNLGPGPLYTTKPKHPQPKKAAANKKPVVRSGHHTTTQSGPHSTKVSAPVRTAAPPTVYRERVESNDDSGFVSGLIVGAAIESISSSSFSSSDSSSSSGSDFSSGGGGDFSGGGSSGDF